MKIGFSAVIMLAGGCTPYIEGGVGYALNGTGDPLTGIFRAGIEQDLQNGWIVKQEYEHISRLRSGEPFNNEPEDILDQVSIIVRKEW